MPGFIDRSPFTLPAILARKVAGEPPEVSHEDCRRFNKVATLIASPDVALPAKVLPVTLALPDEALESR